jgi:hypothetical protein
MSKIKKTSNDKILKCFVPSNLELDEVVKAYPPDMAKFKNKKFQIDNLKYLVSLVYVIPARNKVIRDKCRKNKGYIPLCAKYLQNKIHDYRAYLDYLIEVGILESDRQYIIGKKACGFKLGEQYIKSKLKSVAVFRKSLSKVWEADKEAINKYNHLYQWLISGLEIDAKGAYQLNEARFEVEKCEDYFNALSRYQSAFINISYLEEGLHWFNQDEYGRLHTNLTNINKESRNFITYNGEKLVSIDIRNSQPYFFVSILENYFKGQIIDKKAARRKEALEHAPSVSTDTIMLVKSADFDLQEYPEDVQKFICWVTKGTLYDKMVEEYGPAYFKNKKENPRTIIKGEIMKVFFSKNASYPRLKKQFRTLFPNVNRVIVDIKEKEYAYLAHLLQRTESNAILDNICTLVAKERPKAPLFTIHDSIVTTMENQSYITNIMERVLERVIGYPVVLKPEYWCVV